jgi:hypothetical protein
MSVPRAANLRYEAGVPSAGWKDPSGQTNVNLGLNTPDLW